MKDIPNFDAGLFRDDGLGVTKLTPRQQKKLKQEIINIFKKNDLKIVIETNVKIVDFLDVLLDLSSDTYKPFMKPGDKPKYVNCLSNHPPTTIKSIPQGINNRLNSISATKEVFDNAAKIYQNELDKNGYEHKLEYKPQTDKHRKRKRYIVTYFNPPFSLDIKSCIGRQFLKLIDKHFPPGNELHKVINRNTVKVSYSCLPNMGSIIARNNAKILKKTANKPPQPPPSCNCQKSKIAACPLPGACNQDNVIYQATIVTDPPNTSNNTNKTTETYVGSTVNFKTRHRGHRDSFLKLDRKKESELSKYIWKMKEENRNTEITWKILGRAPPYNPITDKCLLCIEEKLTILLQPKLASLNSRDEMFNYCRHKWAVMINGQQRKAKVRDKG